ncbi:MAG: nicotinate-nucleotide--dimethylbenzimidazole phosphoribosyltransferase [Lachnospiraceae bacterium]|nr:nicotinate-nucleotide--dimethylbenzimidazole phosphoribosyltransferase [Lachnospiraceae bacterium]
MNYCDNSIKIIKPDEEAKKRVKARLDNIAKPLDSLGVFEDVLCRIGAIKRDDNIYLNKRALVVMCSDNGVVEEGVSQSDSSVTLSVVKNMSKRKSSVMVMCDKTGVDPYVVDVGVDTDEEVPGVLNKKIQRGTKNFVIEEAMTDEDVIKAINVGISMVEDLKKEGYDIILTGEMGIGNTTTSSAICASILKLPAADVTGRGAGLDSIGLIKKTLVIDDAIKKYNLYKANAFDILKSVGGYDIAALTGICIGGAKYQIPVVLDGAITMAAALVASKLVPGVEEYLIASHMGRECLCKKVSENLGLKPVINGDMALGEGTGAVMMLSLLDNVLEVYNRAANFDEIKIDNYKRQV